jgi:hypothetical protein
MMTPGDSVHIRTQRDIRSFRLCLHSTGEPMTHVEVQRLAHEAKRSAAREAQRRRQAKEWNEHWERAAGRGRRLPPAASSRQTKGD